MSNPILEVKDLRVYYKSIWGDYRVVDGVDLTVNKGEILGLAGESGCGKSTLVEGILRLVEPPGFIAGGKVIFKGIDLLSLSEEELRKIRWRQIAYIPQGSMNSLNPVIKVKDQMIDVMIDHGILDKEEAEKRALELLEAVGLPSETADMYPHQLSGGMRQRVIIAMAMSLNPELVVADEPTTALDIVMQKTVLLTIAKLRDDYGSSVILVSHDMAAHAEIADRIAIMYAGKIIEVGDVHDIFKEPAHPYTRMLIDSIPRLEKKMLRGIPGLAPSPLRWPSGCRFHSRCPLAKKRCRYEEPSLKSLGAGHLVACHLWG
ncbi:MAG: ABC transporter ATP-binding protein [Thermoprotei archaeon]|nr:MAG: ABC transporter ATP-binding protein [Thermoprotei archaeon]